MAGKKKAQRSSARLNAQKKKLIINSMEDLASVEVTSPQSSDGEEVSSTVMASPLVKSDLALKTLSDIEDEREKELGSFARRTIMGSKPAWRAHPQPSHSLEKEISLSLFTSSPIGAQIPYSPELGISDYQPALEDLEDVIGVGKKVDSFHKAGDSTTPG